MVVVVVDQPITVQTLSQGLVLKLRFTFDPELDNILLEWSFCNFTISWSAKSKVRRYILSFKIASYIEHTLMFCNKYCRIYQVFWPWPDLEMTWTWPGHDLDKKLGHLKNFGRVRRVCILHVLGNCDSGLSIYNKSYLVSLSALVDLCVIFSYQENAWLIMWFKRRQVAPHAGLENSGFELITNNSNSNTFDVSLLKYYITNN